MKSSMPYRQPQESLEPSPSVVFQKLQPPINQGGGRVVHTMFRYNLLIFVLWNLYAKTRQE